MINCLLHWCSFQQCTHTHVSIERRHNKWLLIVLNISTKSRLQEAVMHNMKSHLTKEFYLSILFLCLFLSLWPFRLYFIPHILTTTLRFLTLFLPRSGELRMQKLKSHLVRAQSLNVLPLKSGVGQYIAIHATLTARNFFLAYFYPSGPFTCIFSKTSPNFFLCWLWLTPDPV